MRIPPASMAFTLLMSFLSALPSFAIDMSLPAITETAASLRVAPAQAGLMMSLFMVGFAVAPLFYGPASDRYGRKPIVVFACMLFVIAGIGCALAQSLPTLLMWRVVQGAGAGASMTIALAIIRDLFEGQAARTKLPLKTTSWSRVSPKPRLARATTKTMTMRQRSYPNDPRRPPPGL